MVGSEIELPAIHLPDFSKVKAKLRKNKRYGKTVKYAKKTYSRIYGLFSDEKAPIVFVSLMIIAYTTIFGLVNIYRTNHFDGLSGFDLAIPDQGIWLMSNLKNPFSTVRGLHLFGDHTPYIYLFIVPLYWIYSSINTLLIIHTFSLAAGALAVYLIGKHIHAQGNGRKRGRGCSALDLWKPVVYSFIYLMYPALNYLNMDLLFSESFAVPLILFAFYFSLKGMRRWFMVFSALALLCKEDAALSVFALGAYVFVKHDRKSGAKVAALSVVFFMVNLFVLLPYFNGFGYFRHLYGYSVLGRLGHSPQDIYEKITEEPDILVEILNTEDNRNYIWDLLSPVLFIPLLSPLALAMALPTLSANLISSYYYTHFIKYHYTALLIPFIMISLMYGIKRISKIRVFYGGKKLNTMFPIYILLVAACLHANNEIGGEYNLVKNPENVEDAIRNLDEYSEYHRQLIKAVALIPDEASVSASYHILTHLSHRKRVYMYTSPFKAAYWGINGEGLPSEKPQYIILDTTLTDQHGKRILKNLIDNRSYAVIHQRGTLKVLRKNEPKSP